MSFEDDFLEEEEAYGEVPEFEQPNFEEIFTADVSELGQMIRLEGAQRKSLPVLGRLAKARLIAARAGQISIGSPSTIPIERLFSGEYQEIAKQELEERVIPIKIVRKFPDRTYEVWSITEFKRIYGERPYKRRDKRR